MAFTQPVSASPILMPISQPGFCTLSDSEVRYIDLVVPVEKDAARAPELRPGREMVAVLVKDLNAIVRSVGYEQTAACINGERM